MKIYIIRDSYAESLHDSNDLDGWREYIDEGGVSYSEYDFDNDELEAHFVAKG